MLSTLLYKCVCRYMYVYKYIYTQDCMQDTSPVPQHAQYGFSLKRMEFPGVLSRLRKGHESAWSYCNSLDSCGPNFQTRPGLFQWHSFPLLYQLHNKLGVSNLLRVHSIPLSASLTKVLKNTILLDYRQKREGKGMRMEASNEETRALLEV